MKLRSPWLIRLIGFLGGVVLRRWMSTIRPRICFPDELRHPADPRVERFVYAFWHDTLLLPTAYSTRIHVLISQHGDGEMIAQICRHLRIGTVRGSTTRGGTQALLNMLKLSRRAHLGVTPDGPRGPRRQVQVGLIFIASYTGLPIVPLGVGYQRAWRFRSWDRFALPWPWSEARCVVAPPISVPARLNREGLEHYRSLVEERLLKATAAAERWAAGGKRPSPIELWHNTEPLDRKASA
jgi:lysophospholipid acyltransferase (LPLAT)-like uncharacterized protein